MFGKMNNLLFIVEMQTTVFRDLYFSQIGMNSSKMQTTIFPFSKFKYLSQNLGYVKVS